MTEIKTEAGSVERCETCRFWDFIAACGDEVKGMCRRRAPVATGGMMSPPETMWPETEPTDRCGEYRSLLTRIKSERDGI